MSKQRKKTVLPTANHSPSAKLPFGAEIFATFDTEERHVDGEHDGREISSLQSNFAHTAQACNFCFAVFNTSIVRLHVAEAV